MDISVQLRRYMGFWIILLTLSACEVIHVPDEREDWDFDPPSFSHRQTEFTDEEILAAIYSDYKYPENFYTEELGDASIYYSNTISILPLGERSGKPWRELCTDNFEQAKEWSELTSVHSSYYRKIIGERETRKYFEFHRQWEEHPSDQILDRIHKCSYLDRSLHDRFDPGAILGKFNYRPFTAGRVNELGEYLWFVENYNISGFKVLSSFTDETPGAFVHTMYETRFSGGDWGLHDMIWLYKTTRTVDKISGEITYDKTLVKQLQGKYNPDPFEK